MLFQGIYHGTNQEPELKNSNEKWERQKWKRANSWNLDFENGTIISGDGPLPQLSPKQKSKENNTHGDKEQIHHTKKIDISKKKVTPKT